MTSRTQSGGMATAMVRRVTVVTRATVIALLLVVCTGGTVRAADGDTVGDVGMGIISALVTIPYSASKVAYAGIGGIVGSLAWLLSKGDMDAANAVWRNSLYGTYVITPDHLRGQIPVRFFGGPSAFQSYDEYAE